MAKAARKKIELAPEAYLAGLRAFRKQGEAHDYTTLADAIFGNVTERIATGSLGLDKLTGGGYPVGRIIEICAWEGVGKSTLMDQSAAQCQRSGVVPVILDSERGRDLVYTRKLGVDVDKCILAEADTIEEAFARIDEVIEFQEKKRAELVAAKSKQEPPLVLILWDSLGGTPAREELEGDPDDSHVSPAARLVSLNFRRIVGRLVANRITLVFSNHFYKSIGGQGTLIAYGGKGPRYYTSLRVWLRRTNALKFGERVVGHEIEAKLRKTRVGTPRPPEALGLVDGMGVDNAYTLYEWGKRNGIGGDYPDHRWIENRGRYSYLVVPGQEESHRFERAFLGLGQLFTEQTALYEQLATAYMAAD